MTVEVTWQAEDVVRALHAQCLHEQSWVTHGVSIDSRTVKKGDLFIALKGPAHDGHDHVAAAFAAGAAAAIVSRNPTQVSQQAPLIFVEDTFHALEHLGCAGRQRSEARIVAVTGSVGKTSTKEMLRLMLTAAGETYANEGSLNNHWGVPLSLSRLPQHAHYGVFELGMNHAGELKTLSALVQPDVALITTIEAVHLEFFASVEAIADAKSEIFSGMKPGGTAILNRDNPHYAQLAAAAKAYGVKKVLRFGRDKNADARLIDYSAGVDEGIIRADIMGQPFAYRLSAQGEHLALNSLGALLACIAAGGDMEACAAALATFEQPKGRGGAQTIALAEGLLTLIDESYNASPAAVRAAIHVLGRMPIGGGRKILVLGDMKELGAASPQLHAELAKDIINAKIDQVFTCGEMMKHLYDALPSDLQGNHALDSETLTLSVTNAVHAGDIVTVKGSHSMHMDLIVDALKALGHNESHSLAS
jgi:UDP-N-acetylmuramoyl-tripeptide--D-alanyl-D-alanine ligase